jgi:hypothetical protein
MSLISKAFAPDSIFGRECVQERQTCSIGGRPIGVKVQFHFASHRNPGYAQAIRTAIVTLNQHAHPIWSRRSIDLARGSACAASHIPTQRSATLFCHGRRKAVRVGVLPLFLTAENTSTPNIASPSNSKEFLRLFVGPSVVLS